MNVDVRTQDGAEMTAAAATRPVGSALRIAPAFTASTLDEDAGIETTMIAEYDADEGRYLVRSIASRAVRERIELGYREIRALPIQPLLQTATPRCIALTLDDSDDAEWISLSEISSTAGRIIPVWMAQTVTKRGGGPERMDVVELLYGAAALSNQAPIKAIAAELGIAHRTAASWVTQARQQGRLTGMGYARGRQPSE